MEKEVSSKNFRKKLGAFLIISMALSLAAGVLLYFEALATFEGRSWDERVRLVARPENADQNIKIIIVDQPSLDYYAKEGIKWPLPRSMYAAVIKFLEAGGAKGLAFDIVFTDEEQIWVEDTREFAQAIAGDLAVVNAVHLRPQSARESQEEFGYFRTKQEAENKKTNFAKRFSLEQSRRNYESLSLPIAEISRVTDAFGNVTSTPDADGVYRHYWPGAKVQDLPILSLAFALYDLNWKPGQSEMAIQDYLDRDDRLVLNFYGPKRTYPTYSLASVITSYAATEAGEQPQLDPKTFQDSYVLLGVWAEGLLDLRPSPTDERYRGVEIHATALDNLIHGNFIRKPSLWVNILYSAIFTVVGTAFTLFIARFRVLCLALCCLVVIFGFSGYFLALKGFWIMMVVPFLTMMLGVLITFSYQYQLEGRQHRFIKNAFRFYVTPAVIEKIIDDPSHLALGGERRELTIFFSDIVGFTTISESIEPTKLVHLLNTFLSAMTAVILESGGTLDKYVGDAIVAFWNAPLNLPDHALRGVKTAIKCQETLLSLQGHFKEEYGVSLKMRVGIHTGLVSVGNFGSTDRFNYTVIGDAANLASRLEGANKYFGTSILFSGSTDGYLAGLVPRRKIAEIKVVGKSEPVTVYEPRLGNSSLTEAALESFTKSLKAFEAKNLEAALDGFRSIIKDPVARVYISRIERDIARLKNGEPWSPVWSLTDK